MIEQTGGWQVCVPGSWQVWLVGPLHVCGDVAQVCWMPLQVCGFLLVQLAALQAAGTKLLQVPGVPLQPAPVQAPMTSPLHVADVGLPLQFPGSLSQVCFWPPQVWCRRLPQNCDCVGPVCGHDGLVGSHQMTFSFS